MSNKDELIKNEIQKNEDAELDDKAVEAVAGGIPAMMVFRCKKCGAYVSNGCGMCASCAKKK